MAKSLLALLAALAVLAVPASAHVTVTATGPATAQVGVPFQVTATLAANCAVVAGEYAQESDLYFGFKPDAPAYLNGTSEHVEFKATGCDPMPAGDDPTTALQVRSTGKLTVTIGPDAPGLVPLTLSVVAYGNDPSTPEGGDPGNLTLTVAHYANGTLTASRETSHAAHDAAGGIAIALLLDYTTNAESLLSFEATASTGQVQPIDAIPVTPPSFDGKPRATAASAAVFTPPANWTAADLTFKAFLTPKAGGAKLPVATTTLKLTNDATSLSGGSHDHEHEHEEESPSPAFAVVALGLVGLVALRRRA